MIVESGVKKEIDIQVGIGYSVNNKRKDMQQTIQVMVKKTINIPDEYEIVTYSPNVVIGKGWKYYSVINESWEFTHSVGMDMESASDNGRLAYIRPVVKKMTMLDIPVGTYFFWSSYPNQVFFRHYVGVVGLDNNVSWYNAQDGKTVIDGYAPVRFTYKAEKIPQNNP